MEKISQLVLHHKDGTDTFIIEDKNKVAFDTAQGLTAAQKLQARRNIGAADDGVYDELRQLTSVVVRHDTTQGLTAAQKLQARQNIGAGTTSTNVISVDEQDSADSSSDEVNLCIAQGNNAVLLRDSIGYPLAYAAEEQARFAGLKENGAVAVHTVDVNGHVTAENYRLFRPYPITAQMRLTLSQPTDVLYISKFGNIPLQNQGFTAMYIMVENVPQAADSNCQLRICFNGTGPEDRPQPMMVAQGPFLHATDRQYWCGQLDMATGLTQFMENGVSGDPWNSNMRFAMYPVMYTGKDVLSSVCFYTDGTGSIPAGTVLRAWFR